MSKNRRHRESPLGAPSFVPRADGGIPLPAAKFSRLVLLRLAAVGGLSCVLGFTFNAASPIGVRFDAPVTAPTPAKASLVAAPTPDTPFRTNLIPVPPLPPAPVEVATTTPQPTRPATGLFEATTLLPVSPPHQTTNHAVTISSPTPLPPAPANPAPIHWPEARTLVSEGRGVLVDVRHNAMFDAGHIPGAISLPENSPVEVFTAFLNQQPTNLTLIVYCSSTSCSQSARVANRFVHEFRRTSVRYMTGGYLEYQQAELAKPTPAPVPVP